MPKAAKLLDVGAAHGCFPPTPIISGSGDVSINGFPAVREGDPLIPHACGNCPPHPRSISAGSATVSINGKAAARTGDAIGCGGSISGGSADTFIGDVGMSGALKSCMEGASESASAFVKVDFEAFPLPEGVKQMNRFVMAAYAGPDALEVHVMGQAQSLVNAELQTLQSTAFTPALASLGINPANIDMSTLTSLAGGAPLQDALIASVNNFVVGSLTSHLSDIVQPQLAQNLLGQVTSAIQSGRITPESLLGAVVPNVESLVPVKGELSTVLTNAAKSVLFNGVPLKSAAQALAPLLSNITREKVNEAVSGFYGKEADSIGSLAKV